MKDIFEPTSEPAKSIYLAFQNEAKKRKTRSVKEWVEAELDAVFKECLFQAKKYGLTEPTMKDVIAAESYARGSVDYGAKWAYQMVHKMTPVKS